MIGRAFRLKHRKGRNWNEKWGKKKEKKEKLVDDGTIEFIGTMFLIMILGVWIRIKDDESKL